MPNASFSSSQPSNPHGDWISINENLHANKYLVTGSHCGGEQWLQFHNTI